MVNSLTLLVAFIYVCLYSCSTKNTAKITNELVAYHLMSAMIGGQLPHEHSGCLPLFMNTLVLVYMYKYLCSHKNY